MRYWSNGGRSFGVLGLGRSGRAAAELIVSLNSEAIGLDEVPFAECDACSRIVIGTEHILDMLGSLDGLVISPGVDPTSAIPAFAVEIGLPVIGEIELAYRNTNAPVLAVTGSNGKTTTAEWLGHVLQRSRLNAVVAGNTGYPFSSAVIDRADADLFVLEVSSYQLQTVDLFHPVGAVILNITPDHLQRHGGMENYREAKARIFMNMAASDILVLNGDDPGSIPLSGRTSGLELQFSVKRKVFNGACSDGEYIYSVLDGIQERVIRVRDISLPGVHNLSNALAVTCLAAKAGLTPERIAPGLADFPGVAHRIEQIRRLDGVDWVNDSKSTNPESLVAALESFMGSIVLIAGGKAKEVDYSTLRTLLTEKATAIILIGEAAEHLEEVWSGSAPIYIEQDMDRAITRASELCSEGDTVLLSPACASFDQYSSFEERGDHFRSLVEALS